MKILLLGSTGMFGTAVESVCKNRNIECVSLTHKDLEITNSDELNAAIVSHKPDTVINSVAMTGIDQCETEPQKSFDVNTLAVLNLARICEKNSITLVQISTSSVFDGTKDVFYTEKDIPNPIGVYSVSKYAAECFVRSICNKHYIIRFPVLFGNRRNKGPRFFDKVIDMIRKGEEIRVSDDKIDSPTYTIDAANMLVSLIEEQKPFGLYHVANSGKISYYDFIKSMAKELRSDVRIIRAKHNDFKSAAYKPQKLALKSTKLKPLRSWDAALHEYITKELRFQL